MSLPGFDAAHRRAAVSRARATHTLSLLLAGLLAACADAATPSLGSDASVVLSGFEHTLLGAGGSRGTLTADSAFFGEQLGTVRLTRPLLRVDTSAAHRLPLEIAADSGALDVATEIVRLFRPRRVAGAPATLLNADALAYDPAGDSLWAVPGGRVR
jgi:hypothetical protein